MPMLSSKRQITLPKELCDRLDVKPGDDLEILEHDGRITVIKKRSGASKVVVKHLKADKRYGDDESLLDAVEKRRSRPIKRNVA